MTSEPILVLEGISKSFFAAQVLHDIDLSVYKGEVLGLVGENGAGKSTLMNILGGVLAMDSGTMQLRGSPYAPASPRDADAAGIAFIACLGSFVSGVGRLECGGSSGGGIDAWDDWGSRSRGCLARALG